MVVKRLAPALLLPAVFALALAAAQISDHQPFVLHQGIGFTELRGATIGQAIVGATGAALLGDAIRVGESQQAAEPARMLGVAHCLSHRPIPDQPVKLFRQLPCTLHAALGRACDAVFAAEQGQAAVQIGTATAQNIALRQQRRQVAG